jgi:hypothetical protein
MARRDTFLGTFFACIYVHAYVDMSSCPGGPAVCLGAVSLTSLCTICLLHACRRCEGADGTPEGVAAAAAGWCVICGVSTYRCNKLSIDNTQHVGL